MQGKIVKGIAGFYYVAEGHSGKVYECKAKGAFRNEKVKPLVGDNVEFEILKEQEAVGNITELLPRHSAIIRPEVANIDGALVVFALKTPDPNLNLLDRFLLMMEEQNLSCAVCFNKADMVEEKAVEEIRRAYAGSGCPLFFTSVKEHEGLEEIRTFLAHKTTALAGPSGVGKSSLVNALLGRTVAEVGEISVKNERGKNTTRHSELMCLGEDTYLMDTPGFTSLGVFGTDKENLRFFYPEFTPFEGKCRYIGCTHIHEPGCSVKEALKRHEISALRYENYTQIYAQLQSQEGQYGRKEK